MNWGVTIWGIKMNRQLSLFKSLVLGWVLSLSLTTYAQVGINTSDPQEKLHLAGSTGTLRVESLNSVNNSHNGGDVNGNGDMTDDTVPLYVDENGDLSLELKVLLNTEAADALDDTELTTSTVTLTANDINGWERTIIKSYTLQFNRPTLLEVKYNISHKIYLDNAYSKITDLLARRVSNYIQVSPDPDIGDGIVNRRYGPTTKSYTSGSNNSVTGPFYNGTSVYIKFEQAGTYVINIYGEVWSNVKWSGGPGTTSRATYVEFAVDSDFLFFRMY